MIFSVVFAQSADSTKSEKQTVTVVKNKEQSPRKAALLSAVLPGAGQVYNKKYWKVPIVFLAIGGSIYSISYNNQMFKKFDNAFEVRSDTSRRAEWGLAENFPEYRNVDALLYEANYHRRWRDFSAILGVAFYLLNIVDAHVDAHLKDFDVSDKLAINIKPTLINQSGLSGIPALSLSLKFKEKEIYCRKENLF
ncbi:MAG: DUF5683 domain-containing protein [Cytophagales bacterium]